MLFKLKSSYSSQPSRYSYAVPTVIPFDHWEAVDCYIVDKNWNIDPEKPCPNPVWTKDLAKLDSDETTVIRDIETGSKVE